MIVALVLVAALIAGSYYIYSKVKEEAAELPTRPAGVVGYGFAWEVDEAAQAIEEAKDSIDKEEPALEIPAALPPAMGGFPAEDIAAVQEYMDLTRWQLSLQQWASTPVGRRASALAFAGKYEEAFALVPDLEARREKARRLMELQRYLNYKYIMASPRYQELLYAAGIIKYPPAGVRI